MLKSLRSTRKWLLTSIVKASTIGIVTHKNPDGDGFAASLALKRILKIKNIKAEIILEKKAPIIYDFLNGRQNSKVYNEKLKYDLLILLDCHEKKRLGICSPLVEKAANIIAIDHHPKRELIEEAATYIDTNSVSVGAILFKMFKNEICRTQDDNLKYLINCIYTTILNDTDNFINQNTDKATFILCAELKELGLDPGKIATNFLFAKTPAQMRFIGQVLSTVETFKNDQILFINSTLQQLEDNGLDQNATSKMTRWLKGTKGVKAIVYFRELEKDTYRLSLRSNFINVNDIAKKYDGGGHTKAAGCEITGKLPDIKEQVLNQLSNKLEGND